jgi:hypothetical protein
VVDALLIAPHDRGFSALVKCDRIRDQLTMEARAAFHVESVRPARSGTMGVDPADAAGFVEERTCDMAGEPSFALRSGELRNTLEHGAADLGGEREDALLEQLPLRGNHARDIGQPPTARIATAPARPPGMGIARALGAAFDALVNGEETRPHCSTAPRMVSAQAPA